MPRAVRPSFLRRRRRRTRLRHQRARRIPGPREPVPAGDGADPYRGPTARLDPGGKAAVATVAVPCRCSSFAGPAVQAG